MADSLNSSLFEVVGRLQAQLVRSPTPPKLLKHLKSLSRLPITLDILVGTGVGKTVNALRKYERVAAMARGLVAQWKKLVPVPKTAAQTNEPERRTQERRTQLSEGRLSRKRTRDSLPKEKEVGGDDRSPEGGTKKYRKLDKSLKGSPCAEARASENDRREAITGKMQKGGGDTRKGETRKEMAKGESRENREKGETGKIGTRGKEETGEVGTRGEGETRKVGTGGDVKVEKKAGEIGKRSGNQFSFLRSSDCELSNKYHVLSSQASTNPQQVFMDYGKTQEKPSDQLRPAQKPHKRHSQVIEDKEGGNPKRRRVKPEVKVAVHRQHHQCRDIAPDKSINKPKGKDAQKTKVEKSKLRVDSLHGETEKGELTPEVKDKEVSNKLKIQEKRMKPLNANTTPSKIQGIQESEEEDGFEQHMMSFESYLVYDQPKKGRVAKIPTSGSRKEGHLKPNSIKPAIKSTSKELPKENSSQPKKHQARAGSANTPKSSRVIPALPALSSRVLEKNIDLIYEVGQVPYNILTPVFEKCSPEQLYRIEDYNPIFLEDSDNLWKVHCSRDFRRELPKEFESWREMYLRLHDAREMRLRHLTNSIRLAHARRPKGRRTKMVFINPVSRSPSDISGRQILRVEGTVVLQNASIKPLQYALSSRNSLDSGHSHAQDKAPSDGPSTSGAHLAPSGSNLDLSAITASDFCDTY
ncbi:elongin-A-like [Dromiciops gliroides]|uniref:elongin-A-like n=1 Tax=Dromiciops gliroides TaxID=33562 RepID=UPI001CC77189|nr:elongin-A-like [Dromiciops gliroides]